MLPFRDVLKKHADKFYDFGQIKDRQREVCYRHLEACSMLTGADNGIFRT